MELEKPKRKNIGALVKLGFKETQKLRTKGKRIKFHKIKMRALGTPKYKILQSRDNPNLKSNTIGVIRLYFTCIGNMSVITCRCCGGQH